MAKAAVIPLKRSGALDLLRFIAVVLVFFAHYTDTFNYVYQIVPENLKWSPVFRYGRAALLILFMVSGYVVTMTSIKRNLKDFIITRLSRIYPLFWVSCITAFLLTRLIHTHTYLPHVTFKTFLVNMTMVPTLFGQEMINPVFHTLLIELIFYFIVSIIIAFNLWNRILIIISILLAYCLFHGLDKVSGLQSFIPAFMAGMLFYLIKTGYDKSWKLYSLLGVSVICSLMSGIVLTNDMKVFYNDPNAYNLWVLCFIIIAVYVLFYVIVTDKIHITNHPLIQVLGEIAYPFYLFHIYFLAVMWFFRDTIQPDLLLLSLLVLTILVSWLLNIMVEKPLSRLANKLLVQIFGQSKT